MFRHPHHDSIHIITPLLIDTSSCASSPRALAYRSLHSSTRASSSVPHRLRAGKGGDGDGIDSDDGDDDSGTDSDGVDADAAAADACDDDGDAIW